MYKFSYCYDENEKAIRITEGTSVVVWAGVEKEAFDEMAKHFLDLTGASVFLMQQGCKKSYGDGKLA